MSRIAFAFAALVLAASAAQAQPASTPDMKASRQSVQEACTQDVHTLCGDVQPGGGKIMRCLKDHKDQVSQGCKDAVAAMRAARKAGN